MDRRPRFYVRAAKGLHTPEGLKGSVQCTHPLILIEPIHSVRAVLCIKLFTSSASAVAESRAGFLFKQKN